MRRSPELLMYATIQPIMFVVLFVYVFGGAIQAPGYSDYKQYLLPGIFAQTVLFNSSFTAVGLADDLTKGIIDRLRSLPMYQEAVLVGRTFSDVVRNLLTFTVMLGVAFAVGFRIEGTMAQAVSATVLLFAFSYAFSWIQALVGLSVGSVEAANSASFIWMFPLVRVLGVRAGGDHARLAPADRRAQPVHDRHQRHPGPLQRPRPGFGPVAGVGLGHRHRPGVRGAGNPQVRVDHRQVMPGRPSGRMLVAVPLSGANGGSSKAAHRPSTSKRMTHRSRQRCAGVAGPWS